MAMIFELFCVSYKHILGLDAANGSLSLCIKTPNGTFYHTETAASSLSQSILPAISHLMHEAALSWQDLDAFVLSAGPGSFTGLRVCAATVAGLNQALERPIFHVCSLYLTYLQADTQQKAWVIEDARTQSAYTACFQAQQRIQQPACISLTSLAEQKESMYIAQQAPKEGLDDWTNLSLLLNRAEALAQAIIHIDWHDESQQSAYPELNYIQVSQAERMLL